MWARFIGGLIDCLAMILFLALSAGLTIILGS
jgi:hypothetical protein